MIEVPVCARCGGSRRILGAVTELRAVRRLLAVLGLAAEPPPAALAGPAGAALWFRRRPRGSPR